MSSEAIIERIRRLLALASSANEHEAAAAALKAQELLAKYNLNEDDIAHGGEETFVIDGELHTESRPWRRTLAANVARLYFTSYFYNFVKQPTTTRQCGYKRFDRHNFVGAPHNVVVAKSIFVYLVDTIDRLAKEAADARYKQNAKGKSSFATSFRHACAARLTQRVADKWAEIMGAPAAVTAEKSNLPVLMEQTQQKIEAFLSNVAPDLCPAEYKPIIHSLEGAMAGHKAADTIGLDVQIERNTGLMLTDQTRQ